MASFELAFPADAGGAIDEEASFEVVVEAFGVGADAVEGFEGRVVGWDEWDVFGVVVG